MTKTYQVKTGGKLYLAGEYAILSPGQTALIKNIPIYMRAEISLNTSYVISSDMFDYEVDLRPDANYAVIQETIVTFNAYLLDQGLHPSPFRLRIHGKLERQGKKLGIGSSGSVVLLTIKAMASLYGLSLSADQLFRLAVYVLLKRGDNGSMGDLACIAYDDLVAFTSFNRDQLAQWIREEEMNTVLQADWGYEIRPIRVGLSCEFLVGWTKQPALSKDLINLVQSAIGPDFLSQMQVAVRGLQEGLETSQKDLVIKNLALAGQLLENLHPAIYSPKLSALVNAGQGLDLVAKSSGAGGGDCGLALSFSKAASQQLSQNWQALDIDLLWQEELA
ncbi:phosphomevalonate kinase [Streptococcus cuniculipharyngis]|uniref:phosphomevalonate kinase n=1 Tax=Streptococcus cuniculipharyngis TaxID=1562651 RepID=A0A5C5SCD5_9STRE|nr:phosphomevalonate kinase [Streptococcus cuniculipharyngis]TWS98757.1 phosphomevalonate kinase [Streptococcus cuniculipharyngis]